MEIIKSFILEYADFFIEMAVTVFLVYLFFKFTDMLDKNIQKRVNSNAENSDLARFVPIFKKIFKVLILFFAVAIIMQKHGYSATSLIAGFGITGLAVGFAAKETIANFFGSLSLLFDYTYKIGDYIVLEQSINSEAIEGNVIEINLRSTKIRTLDDSIVTIPNSVLANGVIKNMSKITKRRISEYFDITYDTPNEKISRAVEIIGLVANSQELIYKDFQVFISSLSASSIKIRLIAYANVTTFAEVNVIRSKILALIIENFRAEGIEFAFPTQTLYVKNEN